MRRCQSAQESRDRKAQRIQRSRFPASRGTKVPGLQGSAVPALQVLLASFQGSRILSFKVSGFQVPRFQGSKVPGLQGSIPDFEGPGYRPQPQRLKPNRPCCWELNGWPNSHKGSSNPTRIYQCGAWYVFPFEIRDGTKHSIYEVKMLSMKCNALGKI